MKKITHIICITLPILFLNTIVFSQAAFYKGYAIMLAGDTLKGEIKMNPKKDLDLYSKVQIKKGNEAPKTLKANKVKEYMVDSTVFVSRNIDGEQVFIKRISTGAVNLYVSKIEVMQMNQIKEKLDYYMEKAGEIGPIHIKSSKFKKQVADAMSDNEDIVKGLEEKKYDYDNIVEVFDEYNKTSTSSN